MSGAGVVQPLAPKLEQRASVPVQDEFKSLEIDAIIDGLKACMIVFDEQEKEETEKIIKGLEALKILAI